MKRSLLILAALAASASLLATPLVGRGPGTLRPMQFLAQLNNTYVQTAYRWDTTALKWVDQTDAQKVTTLWSTFMGAFAPVDRWELQTIVPLGVRSQDTLNSFGVGDIELHTRYAIMRGRGVPFNLTGVAGVAFPTADQDARPLIGDGKFAGAAGLIAGRRFGSAVTHLRAAYWYNGNTNDTTKVGNMLEYVAKFDYDFTRQFQVWLSLVGTMRGQTECNGKAEPNTEMDRHVAQLGALVKPIPLLTIRPAVALPLRPLSRGGGIAPYTLRLDFWVIAP